jgi:hypothetical protein
VQVITQGRNYAAQRLYQRAGFVTRKTELWYHKWFHPRDEPQDRLNLLGQFEGAMHNETRNLAVIPLRGGSKRLPRKNVRDLLGKPIFAYTVDHAKDSGLFTDILVSTDSPEFAGLAAEHGAPPAFLRPAELATDSASLDDVLLHAVDEFARRGTVFDNVCMLWATSPLRTGRNIREAFGLLEAGWTRGRGHGIRPAAPVRADHGRAGNPDAHVSGLHVPSEPGHAPSGGRQRGPGLGQGGGAPGASLVAASQDQGLSHAPLGLCGHRQHR